MVRRWARKRLEEAGGERVTVETDNVRVQAEGMFSWGFLGMSEGTFSKPEDGWWPQCVGFGVYPLRCGRPRIGSVHCSIDSITRSLT